MDYKKPKLLLHACCGVCGSWIPQKLGRDFKVAPYFFNPNIWPEEEYERRLGAAWQVAKNLSLQLIEGEYEPQRWFEAVRGREQDHEGGERCEICFGYRLRETAKYAKECGFEFFATTLTIGRNKRAAVINPIGEKWAKHFGIKFLVCDFKKDGGQERTREEARRLNLYRQNYCGCAYSANRNMDECRELTKSRSSGEVRLKEVSHG